MNNESALIEDQDFLENLMRTAPAQFDEVLQNKEAYETQIIYTQINRDSNNVPSFKSFYYNFDRDRYFYPASTVKMPAAFLALEKLNELGINGLNKYTSMLTDSAYSGQSTVYEDTTAASGLPSVAHYARKIFLVSDNDAFNRLYEFLGQATINDNLHQKGYVNARITHRLSIPLSEEENRHTNPVTFKENDSVVYQQPLIYNTGPLPEKRQILKGVGYLKGERIINEPMDFGQKNHIPLDEMQMMLRAVIFPESVPQKQRFNLSNDDYEFLYRYMSQLPAETTYPDYDTANYYDTYSKFLMYGSEKTSIPQHIRIFNKIGLAYGYLIDNAYIVDLENKVEFMLSAVIHTNANKIYNDGKYEYDEVGLPFMKNLGEIVYQYELKRQKKQLPDLSKFMVGYDKPVGGQGETHVDLFQNYKHYHIPALGKRRIKRRDIEPFITGLEEIPLFEVSKVGTSVEGREINLVKAGDGEIKVLLWSQMHGDESTATRSLFEIFRFLSSSDLMDPVRKKLLQKLTLYFIPMLNPDGAEKYNRRNAWSFDLNRDALRLQSPESEILKKARDQYDPDFGFNLHDQSIYYNVHRTGKPASISFLAPAYNYEKEVNDTRRNAMKVIVSMNKVLQEYIPGQVGKYDDSFEPRAFGDNIQKWGTSTILIESGGYPDDPEKTNLVKLNFVAMLTALIDIAEGDYENEVEEDYYDIPDNDRKLFDLLIRNVGMEKDGHSYTSDIGIFLHEIAADGSEELYYRSAVADMGDLSTYYGYKEIDAEGMTLSTDDETTSFPALGKEAYFLLKKDNKNILAISNGQIINLE
ncbi:M14 family zinc carboxypeptidase [Fulvivirgaceae bacterium BMA12]|uniref:M14 family zinc carboxypeptidase n=1 Tax=Agaribacillus aureus TaxID=3051825 RepID=A0ABT8L949_9BACT|nr:M14 family zinc carboxypeptidase [Fulvivirgaceae bacterium BMA12]